MNKTSSILLMFGVSLGYSLSSVIYVKKHIDVNITDTTATITTNANRDGDTYSIILNNDTVSKGIVVNGKWK